MNPEAKSIQTQKVEILFQIIDELLAELRKYDPKLQKALATNSKLNDYFLIRIGAK